MPVSDNTRGAALMAFSVLCFTANDTMMKFLFGDIPLFQAVLLRGLLCLPVITYMAHRRAQLFVRATRHDMSIVLIRAGAEVAATICFLTALANMPLANTIAILQTLPMSVTMVAALFLGEPVGWRRWSAIIIGFIGVLIIIRPGTEGFSLYSLWGLAAVVCVTVRDIVTRRLSREMPSLFVTLITAIAITGLGAVMMPASGWVPPSLTSWVVLVATACVIVVAYLFSVMTMRVGDISFVSPFRYSALIWAIILGYMVFDEWPDNLTLIGMAIIVTTGIYMFRRERIVTSKKT
ncbi:DMT family transporter [Candidatus Puniceispirillum marinum]|nr:DMT family transporter [Candidatus Puniceispirillum marinum]